MPALSRSGPAVARSLGPTWPIVILVCALLAGGLARAADPVEGEPEPSAVGSEKPAPAGTEKPATEPATLVQSLPADSGVAVQTLCTNCNNADLSIAGLGDDHVSVLCDGLPVASGLGQVYLLSVMPPTRIDKITVQKGAGNAELHGAAIGGSVGIERPEAREGLSLNAAADAGSYGWKGTRADVSGRAGRVGGHFVGSWSESDSIDPDGDGFANLPEFERLTLEGGVEIEPTPRQRLRFGVVHFDEDQVDGPAGVDFSFVGFPFPQPTFAGYNKENVELQRDQYDGSYAWQIGSVQLDFKTSFAEREQDVEETEGVTTPCQDFFTGELGTFCTSYLIDEDNLHAAFSGSVATGQQSRVRAGVALTQREFNVIDARYNQTLWENLDQQSQISGLPNLFPRDFALVESIDETGGWVEGEASLGTKVELAGGVRYTDFRYEDNEAELNELSYGLRDEWLELPLPEGDRLLPRAALTYKPADDWELRFSAGAGLRAPTPAFDQVCCGRRYRGNRGLALEESTSFGTEVTYQPGPRYRVGASWFQTDFDDLIINLATRSELFQHTYQNANVRDARTTSATIEGRIEAGSWLVTTLSFTRVETENRDPEGAIEVLIDQGGPPTPETLHYGAIPYTFERRGALSFQIRAPWQLDFQLSTQYTGPMWIQEFGFAGIQDELVRTEDFWVVNLYAVKELAGGIAVFGGVDNIWDYTQPDLGVFTFDYNWGPLRGRYVYGGVNYRF